MHVEGLCCTMELLPSWEQENSLCLSLKNRIVLQVLYEHVRSRAL